MKKKTKVDRTTWFYLNHNLIILQVTYFDINLIIYYCYKSYYFININHK